MNARRDPSGDQAGELLEPGAWVSWRTSPEVASASQISVSQAFSSQFVSRSVKATRAPSGEIAGDPTRLTESTSSMVGTRPARAAGATTRAETIARPSVRMGSRRGMACRSFPRPAREAARTRSGGVEPIPGPPGVEPPQP